MDKRSRIWIIVLALLLAAALALCVVFKLRLDDMSDKYDAADARRIEAELKLAETVMPTDEPTNKPTDEPAAEPTNESTNGPDVTDDPRASEIETLTAELEAAQARESALQAENESLKAELAAYSEATADPENTVDVEALQDELAAALKEVETLTGRAETAEAEIAAMAAASETTAAELTAATERAAAAETELEAMTRRAETAEAELEAMTERAENAEAELARANAELAAYHVNADVEDGEKHFSAAADDVVYVSADGVSAEYVVSNNAASGNSIVFELSLDGEVIYTSEKLAPGRQIDGFTLASALNPGSYEGSVSIKTLNTKGDVISVIAATVTIEVAR